MHEYTKEMGLYHHFNKYLKECYEKNVEYDYCYLCSSPSIHFIEREKIINCDDCECEEECECRGGEKECSLNHFGTVQEKCFEFVGEVVPLTIVHKQCLNDVLEKNYEAALIFQIRDYTVKHEYIHSPFYKFCYDHSLLRGYVFFDFSDDIHIAGRSYKKDTFTIFSPLIPFFCPYSYISTPSNSIFCKAINISNSAMLTYIIKYSLQRKDKNGFINYYITFKNIMYQSGMIIKNDDIAAKKIDVV